MTQNELIDMWHKAWPDKGSFVRASAQDLEAFAKLVEERAAAKEREACAKAFDELAEKATSVKDLMYLNMTAAAIRARGNP